MNLFTYLLAKNDKFSLVHKGDLFSYLLGKNNSIPLKVAEGVSITIEALKTKINELKMTKESTQETTEGKNLLNLEDIVRSASNVIFNSQTSNSVNASGSTAWNSFGYFINNIEHNTDYTLSFKMIEKGISSKKRVQIIGNNSASVNGSTTIQNKSLGTLELNSEINDFVTFNSGDYEYIGLVFWNNDSGTALSSSTIWNITNIQLEQGSTATPYEPYTNGASPNPSYPQEVKTVKGYRNLFDYTTMENGQLNNDGTVSNAQYRLVSDYIEAKASTTYYMKWTYTVEENTYLIYAEYDENKNFISRTVSTESPANFTTSSTTKYIKICLSRNTNALFNINDLSKVMLSTKNYPYVPYGNNWIYTEVSNGTDTNYYTIPLNENEIAGIGDYKDELLIDKDGKCYLNKKVGKVVYDGSNDENWVKSSNTNVDRYVINSNLYLANVNSLCNCFSYGSSTNYTVGKWNNNVSVQMIFNFASYGTSTLEQWKEWLSTHNLILYQPLATPQLIDLNYTVDIRLFKGVNNISNSDDMNMTLIYK